MNYLWGQAGGITWVKTDDAFYQSNIDPDKVAEIKSNPDNIGTEYVIPPEPDDDDDQ